MRPRFGYMLSACMSTMDGVSVALFFLISIFRRLTPSVCLSGQRLCVLDLTRLILGSLCITLLADLGANVRKVKKPVTGDLELKIIFYKG